MFITDQGYESRSDEEIAGEDDEMPAFEGGDFEGEEEVKELDKCEGRLLVTMRALSIHLTQEDEIQ